MAFDRITYMRVWSRENRLKNLEACRLSDSLRHAKEKNAAFSMLGGVCSGCGEDELEFLTLEHVNGGGYQHRKERGRRSIYSDISRERVDLSGYTVLCRNCNSGKAVAAERLTEPSSIHPFTGGECSKCRRPKIRRQSQHPKYGTRIRSDCLHCDKLSRQAVKTKAFSVLGDLCRCCSEDDPDKLTVDHVHDDGFLWRKEHGNNHTAIYRQIVARNYADGVFQLLCWNCNFSKHLGRGLCVHERKRG